MSNFKVVNLGDAEIFQFINIKTGWTKEYYSKIDTGDSSKGYPVYTAAEAPVAYVTEQHEKLIAVSEDDCIFSFASNGDGSAGRNFVLHKTNFYISNDRTVIKLCNRRIDIDYVLFCLRNMKEDYGFDFAFKAVPANVMNVVIDIPLDCNNEFDINEQIRISGKHNKIKGFKQVADFFISDLEQCTISIKEFLSGIHVKELSLANKNYFRLSIGERLYKKDQLDVGVPVYSANVNKAFGYIATSKIDFFDLPSLIWGIDGIFDWAYIPEQHVFDITDHCGRLQINNENIFPKYVFYYLKATKDQYGFDRTFRSSLKNIKENIVLELPIDSSGNYDYAKQVEICQSYEKLFSFKEKVVYELLDAVENNILIN
ncbi:hypothetical protein ACKVM6_03605 [Pantoea agglomerans]|uniref:hypothetical protein n=1 Tax=Enterobacter agglomerans TaxID=549 RepID=UPI00390BD4CA